jgi:hypothetical protein
MRLILLSILFLAFSSVDAQQYTYQIQPKDTTFTLDVITSYNSSRETIERWYNLDSTQLRSVQYSRINDAYQKIAQSLTAVENQQAMIRNLRRSLRQYNLDDYNNQKAAELDSFYCTTNWTYTTSTGKELELTPVYRKGQTTELRAPDGTRVATIVPFSVDYVRLLIATAYRESSVTNVFVAGQSGNNYLGTDNNDVWYRLVRKQ